MHFIDVSKWFKTKVVALIYSPFTQLTSQWNFSSKQRIKDLRWRVSYIIKCIVQQNVLNNSCSNHMYMFAVRCPKKIAKPSTRQILYCSRNYTAGENRVRILEKFTWTKGYITTVRLSDSHVYMYRTWTSSCWCLAISRHSADHKEHLVLQGSLVSLISG